jgi:hypothetical protein
MSARTSALRIFAVLATTLAFAACDEKTPTPPVVVPTISITPTATIQLNVGQTATVSGVVTGLTANTVTYASDRPAVATVNATTGLVTAVSAGTATITATSTEQPTLRASVQVIVGGAPSAPASVSIQSITGLNGQVVDFSNAFGQINVNLNVDVPVGTRVDSVQVLVDNAVVCSQAFTAPAAIDPGVISTDAAEAAVIITCPINTAEVNAAGVPRFPNGPHTISARLRTAGATTVATPSSPITFNNTSFIRAVITSPAVGTAACTTGGNVPGPGNLAPVGSLWCRGAVTVTLTPSIFAAGGQGGAGGLSTATVTLATSGRGVNGLVGCQPTGTLATDPTIAMANGGAGVAGANAGATPNCAVASASQTDSDAANGLSVTFPETALMSANGVMGVEDLITITIQSTTTGGQPGPVCINPDPSTNPQNPVVSGGAVVSCGSGFAINAAAGNQLRLDNLGPRITRFDITPADCPVGTTCYINAPAFITNNPNTTPASSFQSVDYGVDSQTQTFTMGTTTAGQAAVPASFTAANETATSGTNFAAVTVVDKLGNSSGVRFATATPGNTSTSTTGAQAFGIDVTAPTCAFTDTPDVGFVLANELKPEAGDVFQVSFSDSSVPPGGPSGFPINPVSRTQILRNPTTPLGNTLTTCLVGTFDATTLVCSPTSVPPDGGSNDPFNTPSVNNPGASPAGTDGYATETATIRDQAGNLCASGTLVRTALDDDLVPTVGAISGPSIIPAGNNAVTFTAGAIDNIDLGTATPQFDYGAVVTNLRTGTAATLGTFGFDVFSTSATVTVTDPSFIRSVETTAAGVPSGVVTNASAAELIVADVAGNSVTASTDISASVAAGGSFGPYSANNPALTSFSLASTNVALCNGSTNDNAGVANTGAACPTIANQSTVLTATATGPQGTFANPFQRVNFYRQLSTSATAGTVLIGTGSVSVTDITTAPGERRYTYTLTWTPAGLAQGTYNVYALGVDAQGRALQTNVILHTITND